MQATQPAVSVIIATFESGDGLDRVVSSLDAQTMPADEFEVLFVDDGSADDTGARLSELAANRRNVTVMQVEHSGWPSRPRNIGIEAARGEYVFFMDHDDSLYPDALRRIYEFAVENDSDVVNGKESMSNDVWWAADSMADGNIVNIRSQGGVSKLRELMPHKLYRRSLLMEHDIRFPEGRRFLWEDWYINLPAYRHAKVVSVLADTPIYLWHASPTNTTHTFDCAREDYWDRLEDLFDHIGSILAGPQYERDRLDLLLYNVQVRVIQRFANMLTRTERPTQQIVDRAFDRARTLLSDSATPTIEARLSKKHQALAHLFRHATHDDVLAFELATRSIRVHAEIVTSEWRGDALELDVATHLSASDYSLARLVADKDRIRLKLDPRTEQLIPDHLLDVTDELQRMQVDIALRDRFRYVSWKQQSRSGSPHVECEHDNSIVLAQPSKVGIDFAVAAGGNPLEPSVWDLRLRASFDGMERKVGIGMSGRAMPAVVGTGPAVLYRNNSGFCSIDSAQQLRTLALDSIPSTGQIGPIDGFSTTLTTLHMNGSARLPAQLAVVPHERIPDDEDAGTQEQLLRLADEFPLCAEVVVDKSGGRLVGHGRLAPGDYAVYAHRREGLMRTRFDLTVNPAGDAQLLAR